MEDGEKVNGVSIGSEVEEFGNPKIVNVGHDHVGRSLFITVASFVVSFNPTTRDSLPRCLKCSSFAA